MEHLKDQQNQYAQMSWLITRTLDPFDQDDNVRRVVGLLDPTTYEQFVQSLIPFALLLRTPSGQTVRLEIPSLSNSVETILLSSTPTVTNSYVSPPPPLSGSLAPPLRLVHPQSPPPMPPTSHIKPTPCWPHMDQHTASLVLAALSDVLRLLQPPPEY